MKRLLMGQGNEKARPCTGAGSAGLARHTGRALLESRRPSQAPGLCRAVECPYPGLALPPGTERPSMSISPPAPRLRRNTPAGTTPRHFAIVGAGMAGITCARTLAQAGHEVTVFEKSAEAGGRTATIDTTFGSFDAGAQYFTVRDPRFAQAVDMLPGLCRRWSANAVQMLDAAGRVTASGLPRREAHWVASPGMQSLRARWAEPLRQADRLMTGARGPRIATPPDPPPPPRPPPPHPRAPTAPRPPPNP